MRSRYVAPIAALAIAASAPCAMAQHAGPVGVHTSFGIIVGGNFANLKGADVAESNLDARTGFVGGVTLNMPLVAGFSIEPELLYSQQGAQLHPEGSDATGTFKFDYLQLPILGRFMFPMHGKVHPFVVAGPAVGYQIKCQITASGSGASESENCDQIEGFQQKDLDVSAIGGAGLALGMGKQMFTIQGRYNYGFEDVEGTSDVKNRGWAVMAGLEFR